MRYKRLYSAFILLPLFVGSGGIAAARVSSFMQDTDTVTKTVTDAVGETVTDMVSSSSSSAVGTVSKSLSGGSITGTFTNVLSGSIGSGEIVSGCCSGDCAFSTGVIASPSSVDDAFSWLEETISEGVQDIGRRYVAGLKKENASLNKAFEIQNSSLRELLTEWALAGEKFQSYRDFGQQSMAYAGRDRSQFLSGNLASESFDIGLRNGIESYSRSFQNRNQISNRLKQVDDVDTEYVFPVDGTLSAEEGRKLYKTLKTVTNAFPATKNPKDFKDKELGIIYRQVRKIKQFYLQTAEAVLTDVMSGYMPLIPVDDEIRELYRKAGGSGEPDQSENGRMSPVGYLEFIVESRFANRDYRTGKNGIHSMTRAGVLRELTNVQALCLAIQRRQLRRAQQIAFLAAEQVSGSVAAESLDLQKTYGKVLRK